MAIHIVAVLMHMLVLDVFSYDQLVVPNVTIATLSALYQNYIASRAVDGVFLQDITFCSHTDDAADITEAWVRIDLLGIYSIKYVKFYYRNTGLGTTRLPGYSIRGSNGSTLPPTENACFKDPGGITLPSIIQNECEMTIRFVWIYQDNILDGPCPMLEICEVQVFGCKTGHYGFDCGKTCNHCKNNETCNIDTGQCDISGCAINFSPPLCNECAKGYYGNGCSEVCGHCVDKNGCHHINGTCLNGCKKGYMGNLCKTGMCE
ncbi:uncharacterized protein LOC144623123 [Crassostrea virginica]